MELYTPRARKNGTSVVVWVWVLFGLFYCHWGQLETMDYSATIPSIVL